MKTQIQDQRQDHSQRTIIKYLIRFFLWFKPDLDKNHQKIIIKKIILPTIIMSLLVAAIIWIRIVTSHDPAANFKGLISNLKSGVTPAILAILLLVYNKKINGLFFWMISFVWLIFYPNSSYMITDLNWNTWLPPGTTDPFKILEQRTFDTLIIFSIALLSISYGFTSLKIMHYLFTERYSRKFANIAISITILLSGLGFYMGRMLLSGLNEGNKLMYSHQFFTEPGVIIKNTWHSLFPIGEHINAYYMIGLFIIIQFMLLSMMEKHSAEYIEK